MLEADEAGESDLRLVLDDVAAAGGATTIGFAPGKSSGDWRYTAQIKPVEAPTPSS